MDYDVLKAFMNNEIEPYLQYIEMWQCITALGIKPFKDGNQWSFLYGDNIQEGICGFGDTIDRAAWDFYTNLKSEKLDWLEKQGKQKQEVEGNPNARKPTLRIVKGKSYLCIKDYRDKNCTFTKGRIYKSDKDGFLVDDEEKDTFERKIWEEDAIEYFFLFERSKTKDVVTDEKQILANKIEPKFKVGNKIKLAKEPKYPAREIIAIQNDAYYFDENVYLPFSRQDEWELVGQKPAAWSKEDELHIKELESLVKQVWAIAEHENDKETIHKMSDLSFFLKTLKPQPRQEWSEEDESRMDNLCHFLEEYGNQYYGHLTLQGTISWLKSLRPQSHWRPTEEQMSALDDVISSRDIKYDVLSELWKDLNKLREE